MYQSSMITPSQTDIEKYDGVGAFCIGLSHPFVYTLVKFRDTHYLLFMYSMSSFQVYLPSNVCHALFPNNTHLRKELILISLLIWRESGRLKWRAFSTDLTSVMKQNALRSIFMSTLQIICCSTVLARMIFLNPQAK